MAKRKHHRQKKKQQRSKRGRLRAMPRELQSPDARWFPSTRKRAA